MAYPNYYPYPQNFYGNAMPDLLNQQKMQYQTQMQSSEMLWVLSEVEAQSYPVAPNNTVILWDKNQPTIYIKSANAQGVPSIRVLDFTERVANAPKTSVEREKDFEGKFVPKEDFNALQTKFEALEAKLEALSKPKTNKKMEE